MATCLEMGFLGAAYAPAVWRCEGAAKVKRAAAILGPCFMLLVASALGAALGDISKSNPAVFAGFISFGVVALLFLVTHELLIEAHEATHGDLWYVNIWVFVGILLVLMLNRFLPV